MLMFPRGLTAAALAFNLMSGAPPANAGEASEITVNGLLKSMTDTLTGAQSITVHVHKTFDDILTGGQKVQYSGVVDIALRRPDRLFVAYEDDFTSRDLWYDGNEFVMQDNLARINGKLPAAGTVDATLDLVAEKYNVVIPLAGLLGDDVQQLVDNNLLFGLYIGLSEVDGAPAHQVLLSSDDADWQIWIDAGETALPLKIVITDITEPSEPQQSFLFTEWDLAADLPDEMFKAEIPEDSAFAAFLPKKGE